MDVFVNARPEPSISKRKGNDLRMVIGALIHDKKCGSIYVCFISNAEAREGVKSETRTS